MSYNHLIILTSLKKSFSLIWKNKLISILLLLLQIIFFISLFLINYIYITKMIESQKAIYDYISNLKIDEVSIAEDIMQQKNILGDDPSLISRNFDEIVKNFKIYLIWSFIILIIFTSISWTITNRLIYGEKFSYLTKIFFKIFIVLLFYLGLIFIFFISLFDISFVEIATEGAKIFTKFIPFLIFSIVLAYFMFISISLLHKIGLRDIVQKTLRIGIKKMHYILTVYFVNVFLFVVSLSLLFYFIEKNLFVSSLLSILLMIFSFVFGRIFLVKIVEKLEG